MKISVLFTTLFLYPVLLLAQPGKTTLEVDKRFHDFGKIKEDGGKVRAVFTLKNTGNRNLIIMKVDASCGCTAGEYTQDSIPPGKTGTVTAIFDPKNMVGIIDKTIGVYTNAKYASVMVLELRGEVVPRDKNLSDVFPYRVGNLMFDKDMIELGDVPHNAADSGYAVMHNDGQYPIRIISTTVMPKGFRIRPEKSVIEPGEEVRLYASIDANTLSDVGPFNKSFKLITDDPEYSEKPLFLFGHIKYNFGTLTKKQLKDAPKIVLDKTSIDFGEQASGAFVTGTFKVTNKGKNDLKILAVKGMCHCTDPSVDKTTIKKGETAILTVKVDLLGNAGNFQKGIIIYSTDPAKPTVDLLVKAKLF